MTTMRAGFQNSLTAYKKRHQTNLEEHALRRLLANEIFRSEAIKKLKQRTKFFRGAAESSTPPPTRSMIRDFQLIEILCNIERECTNTGGDILVKDIAVKFWMEQGRIVPSKFQTIVPFITDNHLRHERTVNLTSGNVDSVKSIERRLENRFRLRKLAINDRLVRPCGWDKLTSVARSVFLSWSLPVKICRTFNVCLTREVVIKASSSRKSIASHLHDRLSQMIKRRVGSGLEFWMIVETGGKGGIHVHGAISWPDDSTVQAAILSALKAFSGGSAPNQVKVDNITSKAGWAMYCQKHHLITKKQIGGTTTLAATRSLNQRAKDLYNYFHQQQTKVYRAST